MEQSGGGAATLTVDKRIVFGINNNSTCIECVGSFDAENWDVDAGTGWKSKGYTYLQPIGGGWYENSNPNRTLPGYVKRL